MASLACSIPIFQRPFAVNHSGSKDSAVSVPGRSLILFCLLAVAMIGRNSSETLCCWSGSRKAMRIVSARCHDQLRNPHRLKNLSLLSCLFALDKHLQELCVKHSAIDLRRFLKHCGDMEETTLTCQAN